MPGIVGLVTSKRPEEAKDVWPSEVKDERERPQDGKDGGDRQHQPARGT